VLHRVESNEASSPTKTSLAMNSKSSFLALCQIEKVSDDVLRRCRSISKIEFLVLDTLLDEVLGVVGLIIESDNSGNS
jgi:hypothetical protein